MAPVVALALILLPGSPMKRRDRVSLAIAMSIGAASGLIVATIYVRVLVSPTALPGAWEMAKAAWLGASLLLVLRWLDDGVRWLIRKLDQRLRKPDRKRRFGKLQLVSLSLVRVAFLLGVVMPYAMAAVVTYRPRLAPQALTPASTLKLPFERFEVLTDDSKMIVGWFIPAAVPSRHTVMICHGQGLGKVDGLSLAGFLHDASLNVVLFDFRGHGESDGFRTALGFGDGADIRAVLDYLRNQKAQQSKSIYAIGMDTGAAALVNLLRHTPGLPIKAVALIKPYLSLDELSRDVGNNSLVWPMSVAMPWATIRYASLQTGFPLYESPGSVDLWPTWVLVLHDMQLGYVGIDRSMEFYDALLPPKRHSWRIETDPREAYLEAIRSMLIFFLDADASGPVV